MCPKAISAANRLLPVLLLVWGFPFVLYLLLAKFGQAEDLMRTVHENLVANFFLSMALGLFAASNWSILIRSLAPLKWIPEWLRITVASLLSVVGPGLIAGYQTLHFHQDASIAQILLIVPFLGALVGLAWSIRPSQRGTLPLRKVADVYAYGCASLSLMAYGLVWLKPEYVGMLFGPVTILVIGLGWGLWLIWLSVRAPAFGVLLLVTALLAAALGSFGVRRVREIEGDTRPRLTVKEHADGWLAAREQEIRESKAYPVLFVTTDGGGIRSAYWTATLLGALADQDPHLLDHVYLLSGVSGGSVGAAVFAALAAEQTKVREKGGFQATAKAALGWDFLAAPLARMLTRDPFESVFCGAGRLHWYCATPSADRGEALERIFEGGWSMALGSHRLEEPLGNLWEGGRQWQVPALILNATKADTGQHRIVSNLAIEPLFGDGADVLARMKQGHTLRLSTASLLSARFPVIGVQGEMDNRPTCEANHLAGTRSATHGGT